MVILKTMKGSSFPYKLCLLWNGGKEKLIVVTLVQLFQAITWKAREKKILNKIEIDFELSYNKKYLGHVFLSLS